MPLTKRPRRLRVSGTLRNMVAETRLTPENLIWPVFIVEGKDVSEPIPSMPGVFRYSVDRIGREAAEAGREGVPAVLIFGVPSKKDEKASDSYNDDGVVQKAIRNIKEARPDLVVVTDVCLCAYTSHGHCGVTDPSGRILNDPSLELLSKMALSHARAGADVVAPSDMMDGRVSAIRKTLDGEGLSDVSILSYAAKYASCFYGPFRDAAHSAPSFGDRKTYQMDFPNVREAIKEVALDIEEGADIVMIKPALPYLDVISKVRERFVVPVAAYQVSGEYSMIKAAAEKGWLDYTRAVNESLTAIKRAGADLIITYFAREFAKSL